jgi:GWxTD domain-containing protein
MFSRLVCLNIYTGKIPTRINYSEKDMKQVRLSTLCILFFFGLNSVVQCQTRQVAQNRFVLNADYSRFWQNDSMMYVELSTAVYPTLIGFKQDSAGYHGKTELNITIQNKSNGAIVYTNRFTNPITIVDSGSLVKTKSLINNIIYSLGYGVYNINVSSCDIANRSRRDSSFFCVDIQKRPDTVALSDIELCSSITESSDQKDVFYKNTYRVIPNPSCVFGSTTFPLVFTYMEFYNMSTKMTYTIRAQIVDSKGDVKKYRTHQRRFPIPHVVDVTTLNCTSISSGRYVYEVILLDSLGREIAKSQKPIYLHNPDIQITNAVNYEGKSTEFAGMSSEELTEEFRRAKYITQSEDMNIFNKLITIDAQKAFLEKFWVRVEKEEVGHLNLTRNIYLQRVLTANQRYKTYAKEGWRTDQGRVYILYGEPDETQRFSNSADSKPYEIWNYHQIEGGVEFIFIDLTRFNEYMLVHSTKRGEMQYASWEQLLNCNDKLNDSQ